MSSHQFEIFLDVANTGNMSQTGRHFFISPSAVSQAITSLEERYSTTLFQRDGQRLCLTPEGISMQSYARQLLNLYQEIETRFSPDSNRHFRLGASFSLASSFISPNVLAFQQRASNSGIDINITISPHESLIQQVNSCELDLAAVLMPSPPSPQLTVVPLFRDPVCLCCNPDHPFSSREIISLSELSDQHLTLLQRGTSVRDAFDLTLKKQHVTLHKVLTSNNQNNTKELLLHNQTMALMSSLLVREDVLHGSLSTLRIKEFSFARNFAFVYRKDLLPSPDMEQFIHFCLNERLHYVESENLL